jgi:RHS repeat-associated protein
MTQLVPSLVRAYEPRLAHRHDLQGRRKAARREDGTTWSYNYNGRSEVTGAEKRQENSDLVPGLNFGYNYDGMGNRLSASKGVPALVTEYEPDAMNRYASITSPGGDDILVKSGAPVDVEVDETPATVTTSGDFHSARITADNTTSPAFPEISITGEDNFSETGHRWVPQATFSPTYDDDGNLTNDGRWIYTWDAMNRLAGMTPTTAALTAGVPNQTLTFGYDHLNRRIAKKVTTTTSGGSTVKDHRYLYEGWNVVAQFTADTNNELTPDATYLWSLDLSGSFHGAGGVGGLHSVNLFHLPLGEGQGEGAKLCLACYDANGNIIAWTDSTGRVLQRQDYDPFGNRVIRERLDITSEQSDRLEYGFSTKPLDAETGLIYYIHRYYGPRHGQWLSEDPIGITGGLNLYGFVGNSALGKWDYLGLSERSWYQYADDCGKELFHDAARRDSICEGIALFVVWKFASLPNMIRGHAEHTGQQAGFAASTAEESGNGAALAGLESAVANLTGAQQLAEAVHGEIPIYTNLNEAQILTFDSSSDRFLHGAMGGFSVVLYGVQLNRCFRPLKNQCPCPRQSVAFQDARNSLKNLKNWWNRGAENDGAWRALPLKDKVFYEIGQKSLPREVWPGYANLDPVARGRALVQDNGWLGALKPQAAGWRLGAGETLHTGPTPLVRWAIPRAAGAGAAGSGGYYLYYRYTGGGD